MPPHLSALFQPRPPLEFNPRPKINNQPVCSGISGLIHLFETTPPPKVEPYITPKERQAIKKKKKQEEYEQILKDRVKEYDPENLPNPTKDPYRTLFVGNLSYTTTEKKLKKELERFGRIRRIRMIHDLEGKPRGYAFVEFEDERSMKDAYKSADRMKIDSYRIIVDVERGRTVSGWLPRRLGGGKGLGRPALEKKSVILERRRNEEIARRTAAAAAAPSFGGRGGRGPGGDRRGGGRGGGRGGFRGGEGRMGGGSYHNRAGIGSSSMRGDDHHTGGGHRGGGMSGHRPTSGSGSSRFSTGGGGNDAQYQERTVPPPSGYRDTGPTSDRGAKFGYAPIGAPPPPGARP